jgi:hypothetical protein
MEDKGVSDRRKYPRSVFTYPVELKIFSQRNGYSSFSGYLDNISISGACIKIEDRYGRINLKELLDSRAKVAIYMPQGEKVMFFSSVRWVKKDNTQRFIIKIGIEFENIENWQLEAIEKLITLKNKDKGMMWTLWEHYEKDYVR